MTTDAFTSLGFNPTNTQTTPTVPVSSGNNSFANLGFTQTSAPTNTTATPPAQTPTLSQNVSSLVPHFNPIAQANPDDSALAGAGKTAINMIPSAANVALSPIQGIADLFQIPSAIKGYVNAEKAASQAGAGTVKANPDGAPGSQLPAPRWLSDIVTSLAPAVIPQATQQIASGDTTGARQTIENDPVGQILPYLMVGREAAYKVSPEAGASFDNAVSKVGAPGATGLGWAAKMAPIPLNFATGAIRLGVKGATGLDNATIKSIVDNPSQFTKANMSTFDRASVAADIQNAIQQHKDTMSETGSQYNGIRSNTTPIPVKPDDLSNIITGTTGLKLVDGKLQISADTQLTPGDVNTLQTKIINKYQPAFESGSITPNQFLNLRSDLAGIAKYEGGVGKSAPLENLASIMRGKLNTAYRSSIPGLNDLDADTSSQFQEWKNEGKGIVDQNGDLTDQGINKIANSSNKTRSVFGAKLEAISPGILDKVKILKAIEDVEKTGEEHKVGTYKSATALGLAGGAGFLKGGVPGAVVGVLSDLVLSSPDASVPIMRAYGNIKGFKDAVISKLQSAGTALNNAPQGMGSINSLIPRQISAPTR